MHLWTPHNILFLLNYRIKQEGCPTDCRMAVLLIFCLREEPLMLEFAPIFSEHAVLQRDRNIVVWGKVAEGVSQNLLITIALIGPDGTTYGDALYTRTLPLYQTLDESGTAWHMRLPPNKAGGPYRIHVSISEFSPAAPLFAKEISDLWFGDVFLMSGQSNMEYRLKDDTDYRAKGISEFDFPQIRNYRAARIDYPGADPEDSPLNNQWSLLTRESAGNYPAVAFFFATALYEYHHVPIGILDINRGGTSASAWVDESVLGADPETAAYLDEYAEILSHLDMDTHQREHDAYISKCREFLTESEELSKKGLSPEEIAQKTGGFPWPPPDGPLSYRTPGAMFHTMLKPVIPYGICAAVFYQGEEDVPKWQRYEKLLTSLIQSWRTLWELPELPFFVVQIAPYDDPESSETDAACLKTIQSGIAREIPGVSTVITTDCGERHDIHPGSKRTIGERLALKARKHIYDDNRYADSPYIRSAVRDKETVLLTFETFGCGLEAGQDEKHTKLIGFSMAGPDGIYYPAEADISGDTVSLKCSGVKNPETVRYAYGKYIPSNLYGGSGLPAEPFCVSCRDLHER